MENFLTELYMIYMGFNWFISMCLFNLLHPIIKAAFLLPILLALIPFLFNHDFSEIKTIKDLKTKLGIASMPAIWAVIGLIGAVFRHKRPTKSSMDATTFSDISSRHESSEFIGYVILTLLLVFFIFGLYQIYKNKNYRTLTIFYFLVNGYMALFISFIAGMSVSGTWL